MAAGTGEWFAFGWVAVCALTAVLRLLDAWRQKNPALPDRLLAALALILTAAADFFMVLMRQNIEGLCCFLAVQLFYFVRLGRRLRSLVTAGAAAAVIAASCLRLGVTLGAEGGLAVGYIVLFAGNLRSSLRLGGGRRERFFAWGLFLFFLCDLNVGAMNLGDYLRLPDFYWQQIRPFCSGILWIFYLPSQILISFSECNRIIERKKESD